MLFKKIADHTWMLRLIKDEELLEQIKTFCDTHKVQLGYFTGLGAVKEVELGIFLQDEKRYESTVFTGSMEIVALHGNITTKDGQLYLHVHMGISDEHLVMKGGHLNRALVSPTAEIILHAWDGTVGRFQDDATGLNLLDL